LVATAQQLVAGIAAERLAVVAGIVGGFLRDDFG
jgi:hypothetical protein